VSQDQWLTVEEIADSLKVHPNTVRRWIKQGELTAAAFGGKTGYRIRERDLEAFLQARTEGKEPALTEPGQAMRVPAVSAASTALV
jgi:excisionase family DNA binding protein